MALSTVAYDCSQRSLDKINMQTYSLLDVHACNVQRPVVETKEIFGQIVQTKTYEFRKVSQCKVKVKRTIRRCSLFGYLEPVEHGFAEFLLDISNEQCKKMIDTRSFAYDSNHVLTDLRVNRTTMRPMSFAGDTIDDSCNVGSYSDRFGSWNKVNVEGSLTITLVSYTAKVDILNNRILLRSGVTCKYSETSCVDVENGYTFWEAIERNECSDSSFEVLYENKIEMIREMRNNVTKFFYFIKHNGNVASFKYNGIHEVCRRKLIKTELSNIYVIDKEENFIKVKSALFPDIVTYVNAKFVYAERETRREMQKLYEEVIDKRCDSDLSILRESLNLAYIAPDLFAFNLLGPGYMAHISGEIIHIVKCLPVEVLVRNNASVCYKQIPVIYKNQEMFLTSKTKILIKHASEIKCNRPLRLGFKIAGIWVTFSPKLEIIPEPKMLSPDTKANWQAEDVSERATNRSFTQEEMSEYSRSINFPIERENILDNTAKSISRKNEEEENKPILDRFTWNYWTDLRKYCWERFKEFGSIAGGVLGILGICWMLLYSCKIGCKSLPMGFLRGKIFDCFATCLMSLANSLNARKNDNNNEIQLRDMKHGDLIKAYDNEPEKIPHPRTPPFSRGHSIKSNSSKQSSINPTASQKDIYAEIHDIPVTNLQQKSI